MMRKIRLIALLTALVLVLSACASAQDGGDLQTPGLEGEGFATPMVTDEGGIPVTGETPAATEPLPTEAATEEVATTEPVETESPEMEGSPTVEDSGVPVTGAAGLDDPFPNTLSEVDDFAVVDANCEQIAAIDGYLVSVEDGQILYVVADPSGVLAADGSVLIPWDAFEVNLDVSEMDSITGMFQTPAVGDQTVSPDGVATQPLGGLQQTAVPGGLPSGQSGECPIFDAGQALRLSVSADELSAAPTIPGDEDVNQFISSDGWDEQFSAFWSDLGVEVEQPVSGGDSGMSQETPSAGDQTASPDSGADASTAEVGDTVFFRSAGDLAVRNLNDEDIAGVEDVILDPETGQISHVVLSTGGLLGIGDRFVPVPWEALDFRLDGDRLVLVLDADQSRLEEAPGFESLSEFPSTQEDGWESEFDSYWQPAG